MAWLTKSRFLSGLQCPKRLWREVHEPLAEPPPPSAQLLNGRRFDALVRALRPGTCVARGEGGLPAALAATERLRREGWPSIVHQPAFRAGELAVIADLVTTRGASATLAEVKAATGPRPEHVPDLGFQALVLRRARFAVDRTLVLHVDPAFALRTPGDYAGLIAEADLTAAVEEALPSLEESAARLLAVMNGATRPAIRTGAHCRAPWTCPFLTDCQAEEGGTPAAPVKVRRRAQRALVERAIANGRSAFDAAATRTLRALSPPFAYLDFETVGWAVPEVIGTRPYEPWPFQWSLHVEAVDGSVRHAGYLCAGDVSDAATLAAELLAALPDGGPVFAYNASFERGVLLQLAGRLPDQADALRAAAARLFDLLPVTRRAWYHTDMQGSWSIKSVLPTIAPELDYARFDAVRNGEDAQGAFLESRDPETPPGRRAVLRAALLRYCERDTWALVVLRRFLCGAAPA